MPRHARRRSKTGIYHIILRGINKQVIFQDDEDRKYFIGKITQYKKKYSFKIYAYCLMDNHVHAIVDESDESIDTIVKRISSSYVHYYNKKYGRCGHLFQDRYKSEPVEEEIYFFTLIRYIHQNPIKAGISYSISQYKWSSYREYLDKSELVDTKFYLEMLDSNENKARQKYKQYMNESSNDECLEYDVKMRLTDEEVKKEIQERFGNDIIGKMQRMSKEEQRELIKKMKEIKGIGIRQISRITGISYGIVRR